MKHLIANQVRVFLAIVEAGSITAAADQLSMSKSSVSDALKHLETSLGIQLLIRTTRRQSLTVVGEQFYRRCRDLHGLSVAMLEDISEHLSQPIGPLRITAPHATIDYCIAPAIAKLIEQYPRIEPDLMIDDKRLDLIKHNIDLALSVGELPDSEFKAHRVGILKDVLCASPRFFEKHRVTSKSIEDPEVTPNLPYIANHWEGGDIVHKLKPLLGGKAQSFKFRRVATASSVNAVHALIQQGMGIGILPHFYLGEKLAAGELVELLPRFQPRETGIYAIHPYGALPPLKVRAMIEAIKEELQKAPS